MTHEDFILTARKEVVKYFNEMVDITDDKKISIENVFIVWSCKTLQNSKCLLSTNVPDGMYYEITLNGDKNEYYVDAYKKFKNYRVLL